MSKPQLILRRDRAVAAVISAADFEEFAAWREQRRRRSLGQTFDEVRELAARYDYELETGKRRDRDGWGGELATRNRRDFEDCGIAVVDPFEGAGPSAG